MSDIHQVWESQDGWKALGIRYYVHQDFDIQGDIKDAFDLVVSARALGVQLGAATLDPLANTKDLNLNLPVAQGSIKGEINDWQGYKPDGTKGPWIGGGLSQARFLLTLDVDVTLPMVGSKVQIKAFHKPCTVLLHWDGAKNRYVYLPA